MEFIEVTCPSCFESFEIAAPNPEELPAVLDYDCEVCCRPMEIDVREDDGFIFAEARGLGD
ncbi:MAG: CPXCG motif-containing cysteine-rich protein [Opitutaceae bacterium]